MGYNGIEYGFINIIEVSHGECMIASFVGLHQAEARLNKTKNSKIMLRSEKGNTIEQKQWLMYGQTHSMYA